MLLLVGLGNPGKSYAGNRHNIGFMALDAIARAHGAAPFRRKFQGDVSEARIGPERALLLKPETYMNESGRAVAEAARFHKIAVEDIVVLHDELDLAPGKVRVKRGGGDAGHNGLRSITAHLGGAYRRVRLGIGHPGDKALVHAYVLSDFAKAEKPWVEALCDAVAQNVEPLAKGDDSLFQTRIHDALKKAGL
ncbi:aminoacyl-tRNA hydrolase [Rhodoblastus acidophilus]|uniref:Peptidyl-tRNA hydrolase n=1 Tax=Candidatus Rhodoblastus alkanivorans TaxID=2954117 RepID=A0ABS9Z461_9HYPH|nr:aminoacyl-tRNA hydrolase [Candidatus Rhodoblastus alkanivorans]MCI4679211.1 aminoacyl-tRNA hydrolase [Candidatus Rhodoblastus alkanivorans]MCI4682465.1 aminoacyl-tRNA hydrolase [Candidatus Rhodoblastus alkanivorans]MDI4639771.1 aminoacyl-tRNA hydrolase [Rhodoblastus acidophilus]